SSGPAVAAALCLLLVMRLRAEQTVVLPAHYLVALARGALKPLRVGDSDPPPLVLNQPRPRERAARLGDARAPHAEHDAQELLCQRQRARLRPVLGHEQPARQPPVERVQAVAGRRYRRLDEEGLRVAEQQAAQA